MIRPGGTLLVATRNRGKTAEFREAFAALDIRVRDLTETGDMPQAEETGTTFAENARIKALAAARAFGLPALADDSGLCVDALDGAPGVYSARYAGEHASDADNNAKLLRALAQAAVPADRLAEAGAGADVLSPARFVSALSLWLPEQDAAIEAEGAVEGYILREPRGGGGFGYDPLFWLPSFGKSMAELTVEEKNAVSHRGRALRGLIDKLRGSAD